MSARLVLSIMLSLMMLLAMCPAWASPAATGAIGVTIDSRPLTLDPAPLLSQGRILVPARPVFEALGASVAWEGITKTVTVTRGRRSISLRVDSIGGIVNGDRVALDVPAIIVSDRLMVPVRFISEGLRVKVDWDEAARTVKITSPQAEKVLRVGLIAPPGNQALSFGDSLVKGFNLCLDESQQRMGGYQAQVILADDGNDPDKAAEAAIRLITRDKADVIVGSLTSRCTIPISDVVQRYHVPLIVPGATDPDVTGDGFGRKDYVFRACIPDAYQGTMAARFALQNLGAKRAAVLYPMNSYGFELAYGFKKAFIGGNGDVAAFEVYGLDADDFSDLLQEVAEAGPDILYLPDYYDVSGAIARQAREMGIEATLLGGDAWDAGQSGFQDLEGGYFTTVGATSDPRLEMKTWVHRYRVKYLAEPDAAALAGYNAGLVLAGAMSAANSNDPIEIKGALEELKEVQTPGGSLTINDSGDAVMPVPVMKVKNGSQTYYATVYPEGVKPL